MLCNGKGLSGDFAVIGTSLDCTLWKDIGLLGRSGIGFGTSDVGFGTSVGEVVVGANNRGSIVRAVIISNSTYQVNLEQLVVAF
jgi:hypothetical protein